MGRSVSYPHNASIVCYNDVSEFNDQLDWEDFIHGIQTQAKADWKSFEDCSKWLDREDKAILENRFCYIGVSEYCGLASIWLVLKDGYEYSSIAKHWINQISPKFNKYYGELKKIGTFSNGESIYKKGGN